MRKIIHIDMDAFFASVEQRDNPAYRGKPLVVGGRPEGRGGVVAAASYEARKFGIHSAMPSKKALQLCPHLIFAYPRFDAYKAVSIKIREIFSRYTDMVEPLSLDEAYLDVTEDKQAIGSALDIARNIKDAIQSETSLTASAGVSINKFVAKIASDMNKPNGLTFIGPSRIASFMENLPVEKFFGVGKVTANKMKALGLHTGADLKKLTLEELQKHFGKTGRFFYQIVRGQDERPVQPHRETKSMGAEDTFTEDLTDVEDMEAALRKIAGLVSDRLQRRHLQGRTITLKVKFSDFKRITRSITFNEPVDEREILAETSKKLLSTIAPEGKKIRLLGISLSNFGEAPRESFQENNGQLRLFKGL